MPDAMKQTKDLNRRELLRSDIDDADTLQKISEEQVNLLSQLNKEVQAARVAENHDEARKLDDRITKLMDDRIKLLKTIERISKRSKLEMAKVRSEQK